MGWKPLHPDDQVEHDRQRRSLAGRARRWLRFVRYHPWPALRPLVLPAIAVAVLVVVLTAW